MAKEGNLSKSMNWDRIKKNIWERIPVYPVQYLHNRSPGTWTRTYSETCGNHGPGLGKEKRKVIYQKEKERKGNVSKRKTDSYAKKSEAILKHKERKRKAMFKKKNLYNPKLFI